MCDWCSRCYEMQTQGVSAQYFCYWRLGCARSRRLQKQKAQIEGLRNVCDQICMSVLFCSRTAGHGGFSALDFWSRHTPATPLIFPSNCIDYARSVDLFPKLEKESIVPASFTSVPDRFFSSKWISECLLFSCPQLALLTCHLLTKKVVRRCQMWAINDFDLRNFWLLLFDHV